MLNNWFKSKYLKNESRKNNNDSNSNYDSRNCYFWDLSSHKWKTITKLVSRWNNWRICNGIYTSNIVSNFKDWTKQTSFFNDYAEHSKKLAKIAKDDYGNLDFLGSIDGFNITSPKDPDIADIGITDSHLKTGYDLYTQKNDACDLSKQQLQAIENIRYTFETKIKELMKKTGFRFISELSEQDTNTHCYNLGLFSEILKEIRSEGNRRTLQFNTTGNILWAFYSNQPNAFMKTKYDFADSVSFMNELKGIINMLVENNELKNLVKDYEKEVHLFYNNKERTKFLESIDKLYVDIVNKNEDLKGKCRHCPPTNWFYRF